LSLEVTPEPAEPEPTPAEQIERVRLALEEAVRNEDFQLAAKLRDKIRNLEQKASEA
jgi:protein-arginine kinase activator protein McsA